MKPTSLNVDLRRELRKVQRIRRAGNDDGVDRIPVELKKC